MFYVRNNDITVCFQEKYLDKNLWVTKPVKSTNDTSNKT